MKYKTVKHESGLLRIICIKAFSDVAKNEEGGLIESEKNLSQDGSAWVFGSARVYGEAQVSGEARVSGSAQVYGEARVYGNYDYVLIGPIGSRKAFTTFCLDKSKKIVVFCGCWSDTIEKFEKRVIDVYGTTSHGAAYQSAITTAKTIMSLSK